MGAGSKDRNSTCFRSTECSCYLALRLNLQPRRATLLGGSRISRNEPQLAAPFYEEYVYKYLVLSSPSAGSHPLTKLNGLHVAVVYIVIITIIPSYAQGEKRSNGKGQCADPENSNLACLYNELDPLR